MKPIRKRKRVRTNLLQRLRLRWRWRLRIGPGSMRAARIPEILTHLKQRRTRKSDRIQLLRHACERGGESGMELEAGALVQERVDDLARPGLTERSGAT
jgi:hypothetical protein